MFRAVFGFTSAQPKKQTNITAVAWLLINFEQFNYF